MPAGGADFPHQPLRKHAVERRDEVVEVDLHVQEAAEDVDDVVGVNGGEDEVTGERRLHGDGGRFFVADLADHDLVGVVAKDGAQSARKRQPFLLIHRNLRDSSELVFDRILDRNDLVFRGLNLGKRGVQRRRFAGAGGSGDEHHSVRLFDELAELEQHLLVEAEDVEAQALEVGVHRLLVQDADDRILAVRGGDDGDAEVDGAAGDAQFETAVLRHALLGDVELRHDLDARNDRAVVALVDRLERFVEDAGDAVLDDHFVVARFDVNVRGAALDRVEDDRVDQLDDWRRLLRGDRVDRQRLFAFLVFADEGHAETFGGLVEHALRRFGLLQFVADRGGRGHFDLQRRAEEQFQFVELEDVGRITDHDGDVAVLALLRQELIADHQLQRNVFEELVIDLEVIEVDVLETVLVGQPLRTRGFTGGIGVLVEERAWIGGHWVVSYCCATLLSWNSGR